MTETMKYKERTVDIDMDKECNRCSEKGATRSGLCLKCLAKTMTGRTINYNVIRQAQAEISAMLFEYAEEIDKAYIKADNELTVRFTVKLAPTKIAGEIELIIGTDFVKDKVKRKIKVVVGSTQRKFPGFER